MCAHCGGQVVEHEAPAVDKPLGIDASEKAREILVVELGRIVLVQVEVV